MKWKVALADLDFDQRELNQLIKVFKSKWLTMGEMVEKFEKRFAQFLGVRYCIATSSGTGALHLSLKALGLKLGDEVLVPALTFVASANSILYNGAKPVFVDSTSLDDFNISINDLERKITRRTKSIIVVHYAGYIANMKEIKRIAKKKGLFLIEDAAHAVGAKLHNKMAGNLGALGCFSFFSNKNLATGEGGMVATNNKKLADNIRLCRSHGMTTLTWERHTRKAISYDVLDLGYNYRMTELSAALGIEQLKKLKKNNLKRKKLTDLYVQNLNKTKGLHIPFQNYPRDSSYHIFPIILDKKINRKRFIEKLRQKGIQTSIHYPPVHQFTYYKKILKTSKLRLPIAEQIGAREVTLPLHPLMTQKDVSYVCGEVKRILKS
ncbi:MAG: DegT/DnrJ/EryC1/StrS family aminotransferase [Candidatus Zixiibacteriota bacterium]